MEDLGLLPDDSNAAAEGAISQADGLTVTTSAESVSLAPVTDASATVQSDGAVLHHDAADDFSYVLTGTSAPANAGYVVISDSSAPTDYSFDLDANGEDAIIEAGNDGALIVRDASTGEQVNMLAAPWALDANGVALPTWYEVNGSTVTQHVNHAGAAYPVVADPRLMCDWTFCTVETTRAETKRLATEMTFTSTFMVFACTTLGGAITGAVCGLSASYVVSYASGARNSGKCVGFRKFNYAQVAFLVTIPCYA